MEEREGRGVTHDKRSDRRVRHTQTKRKERGEQREGEKSERGRRNEEYRRRREEDNQKKSELMRSLVLYGRED